MVRFSVDFGLQKRGYFQALMPQKMKPIRMRILEGNRSRTPIPEEIVVRSEMPSPPPHLNAYAIEEWERLGPGLHQLGLFYEPDRVTFAAYCMAYSRWRTAEEGLAELAKNSGLIGSLLETTPNGILVQNALVGISRRAAQDMVKYAAEFGLSPSARARIAINPVRNPSKFKGLLKSGKK